MTNKQIQSPRMNIFLSDFRQARKFVWYILEKKLHTKKSELSQLVHLAFHTSLIVSYSRPFGSNKNFPGEGKSSLNQFTPHVLLSEDERRLHEKIIANRNTAYAHSDANSYGTHPRFMYDPFLPMNESETLKLRSMIDKWISYLEKEKSRLMS